MNKGELVDAVADKASVTKKQADAVPDCRFRSHC